MLSGLARTESGEGLTVATGASSSSEGDVGSGVDSETIVLVLAVLILDLSPCRQGLGKHVHIGICDSDSGGGSDIESISVVSQRAGITSRVVKYDISDSQSGNRVDGHELHR